MITKDCEYCGEKFEVRKSEVNRGYGRFCSRKCFGKWHSGENHSNYKHGGAKKYPKFYSIWKSMKQRCVNPNLQCYKYYGGRGIEVCKRWEGFENFKEDMYNSYEEHKNNHEFTRLERINNDGDYCPKNCTWVTAKEQVENRRPEKLDDKDIDEIRERYVNEDITQKELGKEFGIVQVTVGLIVNRERHYKNRGEEVL